MVLEFWLRHTDDSYFCVYICVYILSTQELRLLTGFWKLQDTFTIQGELKKKKKGKGKKIREKERKTCEIVMFPIRARRLAINP